MAESVADRASLALRQGSVATFYSYKGGVGRTSALAGVALALALLHGKKVLAIDWDLETPDLHFALGLGDDWSKGRSGLLEYIEASASEFRDMQDHQASHDDGRGVKLDDFVSRILPTPAGADCGGCLDLLTAGDLGPGYLQRLRRLDWQRAYAHEGGFWIMERLRLQATELYDFVLIDARAGRSDASMIPLLQFSDLAVVVFQPTEAGAVSTSATVAALASHRRANRRPAMVMLVPSLLRTETTREFLETYLEGLNMRLVAVDTPLTNFGGELLRLVLPYDARLASSTSQPAIEVTGQYSELGAAYERIADAIATLPETLDDLPLASEIIVDR